MSNILCNLSRQSFQLKGRLINAQWNALKLFFSIKARLCVRLPGKFWFKCFYLLWSAIYWFKFCVFSMLPCIRVIFVARRSEYRWFMTSLKWLGRSKTKISQLERLLQRSDIFDSGTTLDNVSCIMLRNFFSWSTLLNCAIKPKLTLVLLEVKLILSIFHEEPVLLG